MKFGAGTVKGLDTRSTFWRQNSHMCHKSKMADAKPAAILGVNAL